MTIFQLKQIASTSIHAAADAMQWNFDRAEMIADGVVRVQYDSPQEMEIDRHFHDIEHIVEEFRPKRVLFDSLSTYGSTTRW